MPAIAFPASLASAYQNTAQGASLYPSPTDQSGWVPAPTAASAKASLGVRWGGAQSRISTDTLQEPDDRWTGLTNVNAGQDQTVFRGPPQEEPVSDLISVIAANPSVATE
jgi:hypothetical protein